MDVKETIDCKVLIGKSGDLLLTKRSKMLRLAGFQGPHGTYNGPGANKYRMGALYAGYYNARFGINSENLVRGPIQNGFHDSKLGGAPRFEVLNHPNRLYFGFYSPNPYTLW